MILAAVFVFWGAGLTVKSEIHSLRYTYTGFSKPVGLPGIHEFTAMGLLDGRMIDYFDSEHQVNVPRQDWMREHLPVDYWEKGTQSRKSKQQWFKVNIGILMERMRQNNSAPHVLQRMVGCEAETQSDGTLKYSRGMWMYSYDGDDFLSFDEKNGVWVAPTKEAEPTKRKWDSVQVVNKYTKGYLEHECADWLSKFVTYKEQQLRKASPPEVYVFGKKAKVETNLILTCLATGFYPKDIEVRIKRNVVTKEEGLTSSGVVPNNDDTFQQRDHIEILKSTLFEFSCEVIHEASGVNVVKVWDHSMFRDPDFNGGMNVAVIGAIVGVLILVAAGVAVVLVRRRKGRGIATSIHYYKGSKSSIESSADSGVGSSRSETPIQIRRI